MQFLWLALWMALQVPAAKVAQEGNAVTAIEEFYRRCVLPDGYATVRWAEWKFGSLPMYATIRGDGGVRAKARLKELWGEPVEFGAPDEARRKGYIFCRKESAKIGVFVLVEDGGFVDVCVDEPWADVTECPSRTRRVHRQPSVTVRPWSLDEQEMMAATGVRMRLGAEKEMTIYRWLKQLGEP